MEDVFEEIFHDKLAEREQRGRNEGRNEERRVLTDKLISVGWTPQDAARFTGLTI